MFSINVISCSILFFLSIYVKASNCYCLSINLTYTNSNSMLINNKEENSIFFSSSVNKDIVLCT